MLMPPTNEDPSSCEDLRSQAHLLLSRASASGQLFAAVQEVKLLRQSVMPAPMTEATILAPRRGKEMNADFAESSPEDEAEDWPCACPQINIKPNYDRACVYLGEPIDFQLDHLELVPFHVGVLDETNLSTIPSLHVHPGVENYEVTKLETTAAVITEHRCATAGCEAASEDDAIFRVPRVVCTSHEPPAHQYAPQPRQAKSRSSHTGSATRSNTTASKITDGAACTRLHASPKTAAKTMDNRVQLTSPKAGRHRTSKSKGRSKKAHRDHHETVLPPEEIIAPAAPASPMIVGSPSGGLRRTRRSVENFATFRIDSTERQPEDVRESSLARGYDALGVELHNLDDGDDEFQHCGSWSMLKTSHSMGGVPRLSFGAKPERRVVNVGPGHVPFAAAMEHGAPRVGLRGCSGSRSISASAMSLDLTDDSSTQMAARKQPPRSMSTGMVRISKSRTTSSPTLPSLPSKSSKLLPAALSTTKHRSSDPLAWSMGTTRSRWGGAGSVF